MIFKLLTKGRVFTSELGRSCNWRASRDGFVFPSTEKHSPRKGFTLIELLVVISIIALLVSFTAAAFNNYSRRQQLNQAQKNLDSILRDAQTRALSSVNGLNWGVRLTRNSENLTIFSTAGNFHNATQRIPRSLGSGVVVSDLTLQSADTVSVIFSVRNGSVTFTADQGTCLGGSADSACAANPNRCLAIGINLQGTPDKRYLKVNERNIFESAALAPCP